MSKAKNIVNRSSDSLGEFGGLFAFLNTPIKGKKMTEQSFNTAIRMIQLKINYAIRTLKKSNPIRAEFWNNRIKDLQSQIVTVVNRYNEGGVK